MNKNQLLSYTDYKKLQLIKELFDISKNMNAGLHDFYFWIFRNDEEKRKFVKENYKWLGETLFSNIQDEESIKENVKDMIADSIALFYWKCEDKKIFKNNIAAIDFVFKLIRTTFEIEHEVEVYERVENEEKDLQTQMEEIKQLCCEKGYIINDEFKNIKEYVDYYKGRSSLREIITQIPFYLLSDDDQECKKNIDKIIESYFKI